MTWDDTATAALIAYWQEGASAGTISKRLTASTGHVVSRSAVLGQVSRLRARGINLTPRVDAPKPGRPRKPVETDGCRWPIGDPGEESFHFCGAKPALGKPYCPEHCLVAYRKPEEKPRTGGYDMRPTGRVA